MAAEPACPVVILSPSLLATGVALLTITVTSLLLASARGLRGLVAMVTTWWALERADSTEVGGRTGREFLLSTTAALMTE